MAPLSDKKKASNKKWDSAHMQTISVHIRRDVSPTLDQIKTAAEREGMSVNAWIVAAIKDKI